jgi:hypothetical protein
VGKFRKVAVVKRARRKDNRKLCSVELDLPIRENTILKHRFDWDLAKENVSPVEFIRRLAEQLGLGKETEDKLRHQLMGQIIEEMRKPAPQKEPSLTSDNEDEEVREEHEKKKLSKMRRHELQKKTMGGDPSRGKENWVCPNCGLSSVQIIGFLECQQCKLPYYLLEELDCEDLRSRVCVKYFEKVAEKVPLLVYEARARQFEWEDFQALSRLALKIRTILLNSKDLSHRHCQKINYILEKTLEECFEGHVEANHPAWTDYDRLREFKTERKRKPGRPVKVKVKDD